MTREEEVRMRVEVRVTEDVLFEAESAVEV